MGESHDFMNLDWVQADIERSLQQAQEALEAYLSDAVPMHLESSYDAIHQVHGSLQMAGVPGAVMLAEQVEALLKAMIKGEITDRDEACNALAQALVYMPAYLNRVKNDQQDSPALLHTVVNDVRSALGEVPIEELALFNPDIGEAREHASAAVKARFDAVPQRDLRKLRQVYQFALIGLIRKEDIKVNTARLSNVLARLQQICLDAPINQLWEVATAFIESLLVEGIELHANSLDLLRSLEREIKEFIRAGVFALDRQAHPEMVKCMLYYVAKSSQSGPHIQSIRQAYELDRYELSDAFGKKTSLLAGPDPETFKTVATALTEELDRIKDMVDLYVRSSNKAAVELDGLLPNLKQVASTLVMLNLEAPRVVVQEQIDILSPELQAGDELPDTLLLKTAEALLFVEAELESLKGKVQGVDQEIPGALVGAAAEVVVSESLSSLRKAKDGLHEFFDSDENFGLLESVPNTLRSAYGGLAMLSQSIPAQLVLSASQYVEDDILAQQRMPDEDAFEALAEVIACVEFCLEGVAAQQPTNLAVLERAKVQIAKLGYPVEQTDGIDSAGVSSDSPDNEQDISGDGYGEFSWSDTESVLPDSETQEQQSNQPESVAFELADETLQVSAEAAQPDETQLDVDFDVAEQGAGEIEAQDEVSAESVAETAETAETAAMAAPEEDDDDLIDDEILEIFTEEAQEVFAEIDNHWPVYAADYNNTEALTEVRRAFHTLKGSGRMVKAEFIAELAWSIENMLNRLIEGEVAANPAICELINDVRPILPTLLEHFQAQTSPDVDVQVWMKRAEQLAAGEVPSNEPPSEPLVEEVLIPEEMSFIEADAETFDETSAEAVLDESAVELSQPTEVELAEIVALTEAEAADIAADEEEQDLLIYELFVKEAEQHLAVLDTFLAQADADDGDAMMNDGLSRALHTLKGSAKMASLEVFASIVSPLEKLVVTLVNAEQSAATDVQQVLREGHRLMTQGLAQLPQESQIDIDGAAAFIDDVEELQARYTAQAANNAEATYVSGPQAFIHAHVDAICNVNDSYEVWRQQPQSDAPELQQMQTNITQLLEAGRDVDMPAVLTLLAAMAGALEKVSSQQVELDEATLQVLDAGNQGLIGVFDQIAASEIVCDTGELAARLEAELQPVEVAEIAELVEQETVDVEPAANDHAPATIAAVPDTIDDEIDSELIEIFLEEADEILEQASAAKQRWIDDSCDGGALDELQRCLHTLKGGARMAGIMSIGDLSHELESLYEAVAEGALSLSPQLYEMVHACDDHIMDMLAELRDQSRCHPAGDLINKVKQFRESGGKHDAAITETAVAGEDFSQVAAPLLEKLSGLIQASTLADADQPQLHTSMRATLEAFQNAAYQSGVNEAGDLCHVFLEVLAAVEPAELAQAQADLTDWLERISISYKEAQQGGSDAVAETAEVAALQSELATEAPAERKAAPDNVRVSAALLEQLVDLAGETSVTRSRIEQQVTNYSYSIDEVGSTIERLREQLRRLENETETQILFRQERDGPTHEGFDPLEMDRYSRMQELSRALMESVSDLLDLKETLRDQVRITENLLLQQSRTNTELHEGLMSARMVPFSRLVPRLRRIVRQVSGELNKSVDLHFKNAEAELDRSLLEHMTAPLEHMLRNALDHGIESAEQRQSVGKPAVGQVSLSLHRDGGDIVLQLQDDGAGIDIERVRAKAIERELMAVDAKLTDHEILQFILQQGFTTAEQVTQISGRGVGMDVVYSEIRQLGGSISIDSEVGQGTRFMVRLPFTVSISRALMVNVGDDVFALPLSSIEGVVRINPYELEEYYRDDGPDFEYAGVKYDLHYLGGFLGRGQAHQVQTSVLPLPVILVRTSEHTIAVQVDSISGSREVVLKPLGPQFSNVPGMSGATILGDGRVVLILDMASMIREHLAKEGIEHVEPVEEAPQKQRQTSASDRLIVMVVDDSVTVRKVASRLLERHGMEVVLAKDGVEAMTKLQEVTPDIMLLDIEMPRMDGFELASLVRHDETLSEIPIVMISSRTGDKHQRRAREIGVNRFMGKPFQETDLLEAIGELTGAEFESLEA